MRLSGRSAPSESSGVNTGGGQREREAEGQWYTQVFSRPAPQTTLNPRP
jgi:hypothetical protein